MELDSDEGVCGGAEEAVGDGGAAEAVAAVVAGVVDVLDLGSLLHGFAICRSRSAVTLGARAAELLLGETGDQADDHRHDQVVLRPELVVRRSSLTLSGAGPAGPGAPAYISLRSRRRPRST